MLGSTTSASRSTNIKKRARRVTTLEDAVTYQDQMTAFVIRKNKKLDRFSEQGGKLVANVSCFRIGASLLPGDEPVSAGDEMHHKHEGQHQHVDTKHLIRKVQRASEQASDRKRKTGKERARERVGRYRNKRNVRENYGCTNLILGTRSYVKEHNEKYLCSGGRGGLVRIPCPLLEGGNILFLSHKTTELTYHMLD